MWPLKDSQRLGDQSTDTLTLHHGPWGKQTHGSHSPAPAEGGTAPCLGNEDGLVRRELEASNGNSRDVFSRDMETVMRRPKSAELVHRIDGDLDRKGTITRMNSRTDL